MILKLVAGRREADSPNFAQPAVFETSAEKWLEDDTMQCEVFGPSAVVVKCTSLDEMIKVATGLAGQLTITLHLTTGDQSVASDLLPTLEQKAGRLICNGFPTGVEVADSMMHGGPYPASTDSRSTSVGTLAINRFLRPVSYQNFPPKLLPSSLR